MLINSTLERLRHCIVGVLSIYLNAFFDLFHFLNSIAHKHDQHRRAK